MNNEEVLNRIEFFYELRDVLCNEKPADSATGLVKIGDVLDLIFDLGLEDGMLFAFEEDEKSLCPSSDDSSLSLLEGFVTE